MRRIVSLVLWLGAAAPSTGMAETVVWMCGLSHDLVRLVCVADAAPGAPAPATTAVVNGTPFPLDPRRLYSVELWSPPTEPAFVEQLARATICYRSPRCEVVMTLPALAASGTRRLQAQR